MGLLALGGALMLAIAVMVGARSRRRWLFFAGVVVHPGWWLSARSGDCGYLLRYVSVVATVLFAVAAAWFVWRSRAITSFSATRT
ncbi:MAG: hypothetical protein JNK82_44100 [Myxococcaceae bacterium]|nr:hypothetical protein [Myxococcaceae bacterium]